ncbi:MAG: 2Fe-2S iron-sulfur cluster-binding protein [Chlamydiota bacterium]|nr:2Fe-2S iron-sulfur cluster-binding protein [Chlamydiota bacterium]
MNEQDQKKIIIHLNDEEVGELSPGEPIQALCQDAGIPFACTEGVCGTCIVNVEGGGENLSPPTPEEEDFLGPEDVGAERLACQVCIAQSPPGSVVKLTD